MVHTHRLSRQRRVLHVRHSLITYISIYTSHTTPLPPLTAHDAVATHICIPRSAAHIVHPSIHHISYDTHHSHRIINCMYVMISIVGIIPHNCSTRPACEMCPLPLSACVHVRHLYPTTSTLLLSLIYAWLSLVMFHDGYASIWWPFVIC